MQTHGFAHAAANAIAHDGSAEHASGCQANTRLGSGWFAGLSCAEEISHGWGRMPSARLVDTLEIGVLPQTNAAPLEAGFRHIFIPSHSGEGRRMSRPAERETSGTSRGIPR
jgi:hypothetical protein